MTVQMTLPLPISTYPVEVYEYGHLVICNAGRPGAAPPGVAHAVVRHGSGVVIFESGDLLSTFNRLGAEGWHITTEPSSSHDLPPNWCQRAIKDIDLIPGRGYTFYWMRRRLA